MNNTNSRPGSDRNNRPIHYSPVLMSALHHGIENFKVVAVEYESREKGTTQREVEPISILQKNNKKILVGWCRLRNDYRTFIIDRLTSVKVKNENFERRTDYDESVFLKDFNTAAVESSSEV